MNNVSLKDMLPESVVDDPKFAAVAKILDGLYAQISEKAIECLILPRIDELKEDLVDVLAHEFHVEGYQHATSLTQKRNFVKNSVLLHRYKGTVWAIQKCLEILEFDGIPVEWFEYGGDPGKFYLELGNDSRQLMEGDFENLIELVNEYKNVRSWLEKIKQKRTSTGNLLFGSGIVDGGKLTINPRMDFKAAGGSMIFGGGVHVSTKVQIGVFNG